MTDLLPPAPEASMVLLVDDQAIVAEKVRQMLADCRDINLHFCSDSTAAVAVAERVKPTVILQDLVMPGGDGFELVAQYRDSPVVGDVPVIVLSSKDDPAIKSRAFTMGANDYLVKIPDPIELIARVRMQSNAYLHQRQRDAAYRALRESQQQLLASNAELLSLNRQLQDALSQVKHLSGLLPICSYCKRIRSDENYWERVDLYITNHSEAEFSHGICPECFEKAAEDFGR